MFISVQPHSHSPPLPKARGSQYQTLVPSRVLWSPHDNQCLFRKVSLPVHLKTETHHLPENMKESRSRHVVRCENTSVLASNDGLEECGSPCSQSGPSLTPQPSPWDTQGESGLQSSPVECHQRLTAPCHPPSPARQPFIHRLRLVDVSWSALSPSLCGEWREGLRVGVAPWKLQLWTSRKAENNFCPSLT